MNATAIKDRLYSQLIQVHLNLAWFHLDALSEAQLEALDIWMDSYLSGRPAQIDGILKAGLYDSISEAEQIQVRGPQARWRLEPLIELCRGSAEPERVKAYIEERESLLDGSESPFFDAPAIEFYVLPLHKRAHVLAWIQQALKKIKRYNEGAHSYRLKHLFEWDRQSDGFYTSEAQFKGAMIAAGFLPRYPWGGSHKYQVSKLSPAFQSKSERTFVLQRTGTWG